MGVSIEEKRRRHTEYMRKWRLEHPEKIKEARKKTYWRYRTRNIEASHRWRKNNPKKSYEARKRWRLAHLDKHNEGTKKWRKKNPIKVKNQGFRRRSRLKNAGSFSQKEWLGLRDKSPMCPRCGRFVECENLTIDHIIPLNHYGKNTIDNIQPLCRSCNESKQDKMYINGVWQ